MYRRIRATICCLLCALLLAFPLAGPELYALTAGATVQGAAMSVSGQATPGQWVSISVERADGKRCYLGQASADSSGAYSVRFNLNQGTYQVLVASGGQQAQTAQQVIAQNSPGGGGSGGTIIPVPDPATAQALISVVGDSATGTILPATSWQWKGECTVLQALKGVLDGQGIHYQIRSGYVSSIGTLAEKKAGYPLSGWLFRQNGKFPPSGGDSTLLHNGDRIEWLYTLDGGKDLGAPQVSPQPLPEINEQTNKELTAILNNYNSMLADLKGRCQLMNVGQRMTAAEAEALQQRLISNSVLFKQKITTAGAIIYDAQQEIMLLFPENVVGNETLVEVQEKKGDAGISDANFKLLSAIYHLQPDGIKFKGAARMGIRVAIYPGINADKLTPAYYNESSKQWEPLPGIIDLKSGLVIFDTAHFSNFAVVEKHEPEAVKPKTETKAPSPDYSELQKDYPWALVSFKFLYDRGIMVGSDQGFEPARIITRAEMAALLQRCIKPETAQDDIPLKDVATSAWYYPVMQTAVKAGWISGYPDKTFLPEAVVTRYEVAGMLYNAAASSKKSCPGSGSSFSDYEQAPAWVRPALQYMIAEGLMHGYPDGSFGGERQLKRAEAAVIIWGMLNHE